MEDLEKQFITSFNNYLTQEAKKLCEDILVMIGEQDEMLKKKQKFLLYVFLILNQMELKLQNWKNYVKII